MSRVPARTPAFLAGLGLAVGVSLLPLRPCLAQARLVSANAASRAASLLKQMTLEEKIGQLNLAAGIGMGGMVTGASDSDLVHGRVGAILWLADPREIDRMQHLAVEKSRLHIPLLFGLDVIHGYRTLFPAPLGMASPWDPDVEEQAQAFAARETRAAGIRWTFTPMVDSREK
jgi:beta-glucosidase